MRDPFGNCIFPAAKTKIARQTFVGISTPFPPVLFYFPLHFPCRVVQFLTIAFTSHYVRTGATRTHVLALCLFGFVALALVPVSGNVVLHGPNGQNTSLLSFPQQYGTNSRSFEPVYGAFGGRPKLDGPPRQKGMVLALEYRGWRRPFVEDILSEWKRLYDPLAVIYYHNNDSRFWGDGFPGSLFKQSGSFTLSHPKLNSTATYRVYSHGSVSFERRFSCREHESR